MLRAVHGHRVEGLLAALLEALPPADPFAPSTIVVGSHLVARWLRREIAFARGIAAGLDLVTFDAFLERTWAGDEAAIAAGLGGLDRRRLAIRIASVLADGDLVASLPAVAAYLETDLPAARGARESDAAGPRRVQLADHLADLAWSYASTRPDWLPQLLAGRVPTDLATLPSARWQAALLAAALAPRGSAERLVPTPMLPWLRRQAGLPAPAAASPVAVFGMSYLSRAQLDALTDLSTTTGVTVYALDPCEELWDDVGGRRVLRADEPAADPLPLILWGRPIRDTLAALVERTGGDLDARFAAAEIPAAETARGRLLDDVRARRAPTHGDEVSAEAGVRVLACPNARRELEAVAEAVRHVLDGDPALSAHEIAVWIASDRETYLAGAPSAFEAVSVPCHLIDAPIDDRGRIGEAAMALLGLPTGTQSRRELLRVMTHPAVLAAHPHVDAGDWIRWTDRLGIVHGADADAYAGTYLEAHRGQFHWDQGVRRLALGAFMIGDRPTASEDDPDRERGPALVGTTRLAPEEVRPDLQASAATYALLVRSLTADTQWLGTHEAPLVEWAAIFAGLVDTYLAPRDDEAKRDIERVRSLLAGLGTLDVDGRVLGFREARAHATRLLESARSDRGESLAAGVMVAPLGAMRALPFKHAFVVGLGEGAFPAADRPSPLDLRQVVRAGDVSPRDRDRAAFLDALLCVRESFTLSYVAAEAKSGQPLAPSSVVLELADALAPYLGAASARDALLGLTEHLPLHRFGGAVEDATLPAIASERWACGVRDQVRQHLAARGYAIPDEAGLLALVAGTALGAQLGIETAPVEVRRGAIDRPLSLASLRNFLVAPVQAWAQRVLELAELPDDDIALQSDEPFHQTALDRSNVLREVFAGHVRHMGVRSIEQRYDTLIEQLTLRGHFPVGVFAEAARTADLTMLATWLDALGPLAGTARYGFGRANAPGAELRPALAIELSGGRTVRLVGQTELLLAPPPGSERFTSVIAIAKKHPRPSEYHLRGAFDHLVLAASGLAPTGHRHLVIDAEGKSLAVDHAPWSQPDARAFLAALVTELVDDTHGYLFPFPALVAALAGKSYRGAERDLGYGPITRADALVPPLDPTAIARRRFAPLVARMAGDHGFLIADATATVTASAPLPTRTASGSGPTRTRATGGAKLTLVPAPIDEAIRATADATVANAPAADAMVAAAGVASPKRTRKPTVAKPPKEPPS